MSHIQNDPKAVKKSDSPLAEAEFKEQSVATSEAQTSRYSKDYSLDPDFKDIEKWSSDELKSLFQSLLRNEPKDLEKAFALLNLLNDHKQIWKGFSALEKLDNLALADFEKLDQFFQKLSMSDYVEFLYKMAKKFPEAIDKLKQLESQEGLKPKHHKDILKSIADVYYTQPSLAAPYWAKAVELYGDDNSLRQLGRHERNRNPESKYCMALLYQKGFEHRLDEKNVKKYEPDLEKAVDLFYDAGIEYHSKAKEHLEKLAEQGIPKAVYRLAYLYNITDPSAEDPNSEYKNRAAFWGSKTIDPWKDNILLTSLEEKGNMQATFILAMRLEQYTPDELHYTILTKYMGLVAQGHAGALERVLFWADQRNHQLACRNLGMFYEAQYAKTSESRFQEMAFSYYKKAAEFSNRLDSDHNLGRCYLFGFGVQQDIEKGLHMLEADALNPLTLESCSLLGELAFKGKIEQHHRVITGPIDLHKAYEYYQKEWDTLDGNLSHLNSETLYFYGYCAYMGTDFMEKDYVKALDFFTHAMNKGNQDARFRVGRMYMEAEGVERDVPRGHELIIEAAQSGLDEAISWLHEQADPQNQNSVVAQLSLGRLYRDGNKKVEQDLQKSVYYFYLAADQLSMPANFELAILYEENPDLPDAEHQKLRSYIRAADLGSLEATKIAADLLYEGPEEQRNYGLAKRYYELLVNMGSLNQAEYNFRLGELNLKNLGHHMLRPLEERAFGHYKNASDSGHAQASFQVGKMYLQGVGVQANQDEALLYFRLALDAGIKEAEAYIMRVADVRND